MGPGRCAHGSVDAGRDGPAPPIGRGRDRRRARQGPHGRPPERAAEREPEALARQRCPGDLREPAAGGTHRVPRCARLRADRGHRAPVGVEHRERRDRQHRRQPHLRAARGPLVPRSGPVGPVAVRGRQRAPRRLRQDSAAFARGRRAADGGRHAAGPGGGDRRHDPADRHGPAREWSEVHAELRRSTALRTDPGNIAQLCDERVGADHRGDAHLVLRGRGRRVVHRDEPDRAVVGRDLGAGRDLLDPALVADLLRHLRAHLRSDTAGRVRRLHAGLPRHRGESLRHDRVRHGVRLHAVGRLGLVRAALHLRRRGRAHLQPLCRLHVRLRDGARHRGVDGAVLGRRVLPSRVLGRLRLLRERERERLRPLGQRHVLGHALLVRRRRRRRHVVLRKLRERPHRNDRRHQRRPPVQRVDRQRHARLRPHGERCGRGLGAGRACRQLQRLHRPAVDRLRGLGHHGCGQHLQPGGRDDGGADGRGARRRRDIDERVHRQDQHLVDRLRRQRQVRRRQRQRLPQRRQRLAAALVERLVERGRRHVLGQPRIAGARCGR